MVDSRLLQANERTLLAWVRTSIALMSFGFVIARIGVWLRALGGHAEPVHAHEMGTAWIGGVFVALGVLANVGAAIRYAAARRAIQHGREISGGPIPVVFALLVTIFGSIIGVYLLRLLV